MNTTTRRKVRADAKLEQLNETQRAWLEVWLEENYTYRQVVDLVQKEFGISVGKSAVSAYYRRHVLSVQQEDEADVVAELAARPAGDFDPAILQQAKLLLWLALARPDPDVDQAAKLMTIIDKAERRALAVERVALKEREVIVREKLAGLKTKKATEVARESREAARIQKQEEEPRNTRKDTKEPEGSEGTEESAEVGGRGEGAEVAAKAQGCEGRSEEAEANSPRFPGYSDVIPFPTEVARESREWARIQRQDEEPRNTREDTKEPEGSEGAEESAEMVGRGEGADVAAKAQSREDRSEKVEESSPRFPGYSGVVHRRTGS